MGESIASSQSQKWYQHGTISSQSPCMFPLYKSLNITLPTSPPTHTLQFIQLERRALGLEEYWFISDSLGLVPLFTLPLNIKAEVQPLLLGSGRLAQISIPAVRPPLGTKLFLLFFFSQ